MDKEAKFGVEIKSGIWSIGVSKAGAFGDFLDGGRLICPAGVGGPKTGSECETRATKKTKCVQVAWTAWLECIVMANGNLRIDERSRTEWSGTSTHGLIR